MDKGVETYISKFDERIQTILWTLRDTIMALPGTEEALKWRVPYFSNNGLLCFLNVLAVGTPELGFAEGNNLHDPHGLLSRPGKTISHVVVKDLETLNFDHLTELLNAAVAFNVEKKKEKEAAKPAKPTKKNKITGEELDEAQV